MNRSGEQLLALGRGTLKAARHLAAAGFDRDAVSRAYFAAFYAAEAALAELGEARSKHPGVISAFDRLVVREHGLDPRAGRTLRSLFARRGQADYGPEAPSDDEAGAAIDDAESFVGAVEAWIADRTAGGRRLPS